jgi:hypothetical protein
VEVYSVVVGLKQGKDFLLLDHSLPCLEIVHSLFSQTLHSKQIPCDLVPNKVHFADYALSQTFEKVKVGNANLVDILFNGVQSLQLQFPFGKATEVKLTLSEPVINDWVVIFGSKADKMTVDRRIDIMKFLVVFDNGEETADFGLAGNGHFEVVVSD